MSDEEYYDYPDSPNWMDNWCLTIMRSNTSNRFKLEEIKVFMDSIGFITTKVHESVDEKDMLEFHTRIRKNQWEDLNRQGLMEEVYEFCHLYDPLDGK